VAHHVAITHSLRQPIRRLPQALRTAHRHPQARQRAGPTAPGGRGADDRRPHPRSATARTACSCRSFCSRHPPARVKRNGYATGAQTLVRVATTACSAARPRCQAAELPCACFGLRDCFVFFGCFVFFTAEDRRSES
jgi:hypothetical protein